MNKSRDKSSKGFSLVLDTPYHRPVPHKQYRINEQDTYNYVRNSVYETFKVHTSRTYDIIQQMTNDRVPEKKSQIDRMCKKYCILKNTKKNKSFEGVNVDVEAITKHFIKSRSKDKQRQESRRKLRAEIAMSYRYGPNKEYAQSDQFFSFQGNDLKNLDKKHAAAFRKQKASSKNVMIKHPYVEFYEDGQSETITNLKQKKQLTLFDENQCPEMPELDDWEKNTFAIQQMVHNKMNQQPQIKKRPIQSARPRLQKKPDTLYLS